MSAQALVSVDCPHCHGSFLENAKLVRPGGSSWCPSCEHLFMLDVGNKATLRTLAEAKAARQRRKERLADLRSRWVDAPAPAPAQPMLMTDVLRNLDQLLDRLDGMVERNRG